MRILIIEDDLALANFLARYLLADKYEVEIHGSQEGRISSEKSDLLVVDVSAAADGGVSFVEAIRCRAPAILLLAIAIRRRTEDLVRLLDAGADDYVTKPLSYAELTGRIRALGRRTHLVADSVLKIADLKLDRVQRQVERAGRVIDLTIKEFCLLEFLMRNAGQRLSRAQILEHVWKALPSSGSTNLVDVYIAYLNSEKLQLAQEDDTVSGADIPAVASQLVNAENARSAALAAMGKISQHSLFDYI